MPLKVLSLRCRSLISYPEQGAEGITMTQNSTADRNRKNEKS